ncbi:putative Embryo sac development arrest 12 [Melia azedarach]|uniref:Embryo sac development arrest 12 n=1 Tax=Melia azedarach TaxID=155640 RepID=A0ACC1X5D4_MELAZ|nr:putative Embryo sac development arrest 12 [Melia azedarach]
MAAQFPPKFNDDEHFVPSDFLFDPHLRLHHQNQNQHHNVRRQRLPCMNELADHFTALSLLQRGQIPHNFGLERFKTPVQRVPVSVRPQFTGRFGASGGRELGQRIHERGAGSFSSGVKSGYDSQFLKPTPAQLQSYMKERANRVLQRQQNRLLQQNRILPYQGSGYGSNGGFLREYGGTGVFHPRINNYTTSVSTASVAKKQSMGDRQKIQATQQRNSMKKSAVVLSKQEEYHLPPDIGLPRDWTY